MQFKKYQHVERLGNMAVDGILNGEVYIFPKLDGSNASFYLNDDGEVEIGSRNKVVTLEHDNAGIFAALHTDERFKNYFKIHPNHRLFGEWLVPHTIKNYEDDAWRDVYIFDVIETGADGNEKYLRYEDYAADVIGEGLKIIPAITRLENPTVEQVETLLDKCTFLMKDGKIGEGIVIKNYDFVNKFGHVAWAKIVNQKQKTDNSMKITVSDNPVDCVENQIVERFLTPELIQKEYSKIFVENGGWEQKLIPKLLGIIWRVFITEEIFDALKKFHNPKIDFALLNRLAVQKIKIVKSELF